MSKVTEMIDAMSGNDYYDILGEDDGNLPEGAALLVAEHGKSAVLAGIDALATEINWSQDRQPYIWLEQLRELVDGAHLAC